MTANETFSKISSHLIEGMMLHDKMADYYDFIGLMGFKRIHEYRFLKDAAELRGVHRYFINHFNMLVPDKAVSQDWSIPMSWMEHVREDVGTETKRNAVISGMEKWKLWEHDTKRLYEQCYVELCDINEVAAACKVKELVSDADMTSKCADRLYIKLKGMDYDMPTIYILQDEIHSEYDEKTKGIGVNIC